MLSDEGCPALEGALRASDVRTMVPLLRRVRGLVDEVKSSRPKIKVGGWVGWVGWTDKCVHVCGSGGGA
jgi:hypothetical protein